MIKDALEDMSGVKFNGMNITNLRYADDAVLVADSRRKLQDMINRLNEACEEYGMAINVKRTKVMVLGHKEGFKCQIALNGSFLDQVTRYKYLGSWITEDWRCEEDPTTRIGMLRFGKTKNYREEILE